MPSADRAVCNKCGTKLTSINWWDSCKRKRERICKTCHQAGTRRYYFSHVEETRLYNKRYREVHKTEIRIQQLQKKYNVSPSQWETMLRSQDYKCYLCGGKFGDGHNLRPEIDHKHSTGKIRGIAHGGCNRAIGILGENPELFEKIAASLRMSHPEMQ